MKFRVISMLTALFLLISCAGPAEPFLRVDNNGRLDNSYFKYKNLQDIVAREDIRDGDEIAVLSIADELYKGRFDRRGSDNEKLSILVSSLKNSRYYLNLPVSMIKGVYSVSEAERIENKINSERSKKELMTRIDKSIRENDVDLMREIVDGGVDLKQYAISSLQNPLHRAVYIKDAEEMIRFILSQGIDVDLADDNGLTPLMLSIQNNYFENARVLIESGASLKLENSNKRTAVLMAYNQLRWSAEEEKDDVKAFIDYLVTEHSVDPDIRFDDPVYKAENSLGMNGLRLIELSERQCYEILDRNEVRYKRLREAGEVMYPVQLMSPVAGITYQHTGRSKKHSIMDCRLVVALIGMGSVLQEYKVKTVKHMRTYTPGARVGGNGRVSGHNYALAIDVSQVITEDGKKYNVYKDWKDRRYRVDPCKGLPDEHYKQNVLRKMICEIANQDIFHWIFTPHYNKAHYDHFHIEIRGGVDGLVFR